MLNNLTHTHTQGHTHTLKQQNKNTNYILKVKILTFEVFWNSGFIFAEELSSATDKKRQIKRIFCTTI